MENAETTQQNDKAEVMYDTDATQRIPVGEGVAAVITPYSDERYKQYREDLVKTLNEMIKGKPEMGDISEEEIKAALEKDSALCDELLQSLEGYADLPADWKNVMDVEDKQAIIRTALNFVIDEENEKFSLGQAVVPTACYFNGEVARQSHVLRRKTIDDSSRYALIKSKDYKVSPAKRFGADKHVEFTPQDEDRIKMYDDMLNSVAGFKNEKVPARVKIMVVDYVFTTGISGKK